MDNNIINAQNRSDNRTIRVRDALIEEIFSDRNAGYVTISYGDIGDFNMIHIRVVTLLVGRDTIIQNQGGQQLLLRDLRVGMSVDAVFSAAMTSSIPPQARAYEITVLQGSRSSDTKEGTVIMVDGRNNFLIAGNSRNISNQIRFNVTPDTLILDRRGNRITLFDIRPGQRVRIEHANSMTFSIPPQTTAFRIQVL